MEKISYLDYSEKSILVNVVHAVLWSIMAVLMTSSKSTLGADIAIGDTLVYLSVMIGSYYAFTTGISYRASKLYIVYFELGFSIVYIYFIVMGDLHSIGVLSYAFFVGTAGMDLVEHEKKASLEIAMSTKYSKRLKAVRSKSTKLYSLAGITGSVISIMLLKGFHLTMLEAALYAAVVYLASVIYDAWLIHKL